VRSRTRSGIGKIRSWALAGCALQPPGRSATHDRAGGDSGRRRRGLHRRILVNVLDPEAIIVGGGLGLASGLYWDSFVASTRRHIWSDVSKEIPILKAQLGPDAGLIGAAAVVWKRG